MRKALLVLRQKGCVVRVQAPGTVTDEEKERKRNHGGENSLRRDKIACQGGIWVTNEKGKLRNRRDTRRGHF